MHKIISPLWIICCLSCFVINACSDSQFSLKYKDRTILFSEPKNTNFNNLANSGRAIFLETTVPIKKLAGLKITSDSSLIVHDSERSALILFNFNGKFINKLENVGRGPESYTNIDDFSITEEKTVQILDGRRQIIQEYSLPGFDYLSSQQIPFYAKKFTPTSFGHTFYRGNNANNKESKKFFYNIINTDSSYNILSKYQPYNIKTGAAYFSLFTKNIISAQSSNILYNKFPNDTTFTIKKNGNFEPYFIHDFKERTVPIDKKDFSNALDYLRELTNPSNNYSFLTNSFLSGQKYYFQYTKNSRLLTGVFNTQTNSLNIFKYIFFTYKNANIPVIPEYTSENYLICVVDKINDQAMKLILDNSPRLEVSTRNKLNKLQQGQINPLIILGENNRTSL